MRTVVLGERPPEIESLLQRRRALGQDLFDEVWEGEYHVTPAPSRRHGEVDDQLAYILRPRAKRAGLSPSGPCNVGDPDDYRVPDRAYFSDETPLTFNPTADVVVEIVSPDDETRQKFDFYFRRGIEEFLIVDPETRTVECFSRDVRGFVLAEGSRLLNISATELAQLIDWPQ